MLSEKLYELLVDLAREDHFHDVNSRLIGVAETVYELALDVELLEHIAYLRTAAVYKHYLYADQ